MRESHSPAFSFYAKEWIADTRELPIEIRGVISDLMAFCWVNGSVPDNAADVATLVGIPLKRIADHWPTIATKFGTLPAHPGRMFNMRLEVEREKQTEKSATNAHAGKLSAEARARKKVNERFNERSTNVGTNVSTERQPKINLAVAIASAVAEKVKDTHHAGVRDPVLPAAELVAVCRELVAAVGRAGAMGADLLAPALVELLRGTPEAADPADYARKACDAFEAYRASCGPAHRPNWSPTGFQTHWSRIGRILAGADPWPAPWKPPEPKPHGTRPRVLGMAPKMTDETAGNE